MRTDHADPGITETGGRETREGGAPGKATRSSALGKRREAPVQLSRDDGYCFYPDPGGANDGGARGGGADPFGLHLVPPRASGSGGGVVQRKGDDHAAVSVTIHEFDARNSQQPSVDSDLRPFERKLKRPPLSQFDTFERTSTETVTLEPMRPGTVVLGHGTVTLLNRAVVDGGKQRPRASLGLTIDGKDGKRIADTKVDVERGDWHVTGAPRQQGEGWGVALTPKL